MEEQQGIRINKYLSEYGVCSRREADRLIEDGVVWINGVRASIGDRVTDEDTITVRGQVVGNRKDFVLLVCNKPKGIVCTCEKRKGQTNIMEFLNLPYRVQYVGRLDKDSEGLLLLTNDGDLANQIAKAGNAHEKEYVVKVNKSITKEFLQGMRSGVPILDTVTRECKVKKVDDRTFQIILTQGLNRQIRRMCEYFGYRVVSLQRIRIMNILLSNLKSGKVRKATEDEIRELRKQLKKSMETGRE